MDSFYLQIKNLKKNFDDKCILLNDEIKSNEQMKSKINYYTIKIEEEKNFVNKSKR